jgi:hypothetical protein
LTSFAQKKAPSQLTSEVAIYQDLTNRVRPGVTTRDELAGYFASHGLIQPTWSWPSLQAIAYRWPSTESPPHPEETSFWASGVTFDSAGKVTRISLFHQSDAVAIKQAVDAWARELKHSADQLISPDLAAQRAPSDVRVYGEIRGGGGYLPWKTGMTLGEALKAAGGFNGVARGILIWTTGEENPRRAIRRQELTKDPGLLKYPLQAGDRVWAWTTI